MNITINKLLLFLLLFVAIMVYFSLTSCSVYPERMLAVSKHVEIIKGDTLTWVVPINRKDSLIVDGYVQKDSMVLLKKIITPERLEYLIAHSSL